MSKRDRKNYSPPAVRSGSEGYCRQGPKASLERSNPARRETYESKEPPESKNRKIMNRNGSQRIEADRVGNQSEEQNFE